MITRYTGGYLHKWKSIDDQFLRIPIVWSWGEGGRASRLVPFIFSSAVLCTVVCTV